MNSASRVAVLVNPLAGAGSGRLWLDQIVNDLERRKSAYKVFDEEWDLDPSEFTHIYLLGGDGTLNYFINKFPAVKTPLSLFNSGTGNDFFWKLYGDLPSEKQLEIAYLGKPRAVDAGSCNGRLFINGAGIGFDGAVVKRMNAMRRNLGSFLGYYSAVLACLFSYSSFPAEITADGNKYELPTRYFSRKFMITIANGSRYGGDFLVAPGSSVIDGRLDLVIIGMVPWFKRLFYLPLMKKGRHMSLPFVSYCKIDSVFIKSEYVLAAHLDGELITGKEFTLSVIPAAFYFRVGD